MQFQYTPGAERALAAACRWAGPDDSAQQSAPALLLGLLAEPECRAAIILARHGIDAAAVRLRWPGLTPREGPVTPGGRRFTPEVESALAAAAARLHEYPRPLMLATEYLLLGLAALGQETATWLGDQGLHADALEVEIHRLHGHRPGPLPLEEESPEISRGVQIADSHAPVVPPDSMPSCETAPVSETALLRTLDAAANRAREGLRVVEDYVRFVLDDRHLTARLKRLRHDLAAALEQIPIDGRLASRETRSDVGTGLTTPAEQSRRGGAAVLTASFLRLQEALRSLEEFGKLRDPGMAATVKQLRYRAYTLQRAVHITLRNVRRLAEAKLYVLIDGRPSAEQFDGLVRSLIDAGVHLLQLRDKRLDDRTLLERARRLRELTAGSGTLFIVNDRPDLAALARADGVHVGQEELSVKDARTIVGPNALVGVSTHSIAQAREAVLDGADYLGVGPTFPSGTKPFERFPGVELLGAVAAEIRLPAFAIGGISRQNVEQILAAGMERVAVGAAIVAATDPATAARELLAALEGPRRLDIE